jgi:type IV pilus assembly protein PilF
MAGPCKRTVGKFTAGLLTGVMVALLAGCAGGGASFGSKAELKTASDLTEGQKRSAIRLQLAAGYYQQGQYDVALDEVKRAIEADPNNADAFNVRALTYVAMGELVLAEENFQRALRLTPNNPDLANNYGSFLCDNGRPADAIAYFERALAARNYASPGNALNNAGSCSMKLRKYDDAERYLTQALRYNPDLPATNANLARIYYQKHDYQRAGFFVNRLGKVTTMDSLTADVLWLAIRVQQKLGDTDTMGPWVTQLRRRFPGSADFAAYQSGAFYE